MKNNIDFSFVTPSNNKQNVEVKPQIAPKKSVTNQTTNTIAQNELVDSLKEAKDLANSLVNILSSGNGAINQLKNENFNLKQERTRLSEKVQVQDDKLGKKNILLAEKDKQIAELNNTISDLETRLKDILHMDSVSNNQDLITLKNNIADSLQIEYDDFQENKNEEFNEDNFEANKASLFRVFRCLKRLGIKFE